MKTKLKDLPFPIYKKSESPILIQIVPCCFKIRFEDDIRFTVGTRTTFYVLLDHLLIFFFYKYLKFLEIHGVSLYLFLGVLKPTPYVTKINFLHIRGNSFSFLFTQDM